VSEQLDRLRYRSAELQQVTWQFFWGAVVECSTILREIEPGRRRPWLAVVIQELHQAQSGLCALCGKPVSPSEWEIDHRIPFCYGGGNEPANLQIAHLSCNRQKGHQVDPMDLLRYLEGRYLNL
jgi:5-methylcytosine-specific restriction endonuclease McrA